MAPNWRGVFFEGWGSWEGLGTIPKPPGANLVLGPSKTLFFYLFLVWNERKIALRLDP